MSKENDIDVLQTYLESQMSKDNDIDILQTYQESQMSKDNDEVSMHRTPGH